MRHDIEIRLETQAEYKDVENITREAFWNRHVPGCDEHYLAHVLRSSPDFLPELDFIGIHDGRIVANIMYTKAVIQGDDGAAHPALSFGPVSVLPLLQGQGIGTQIIEHSLARAKELGFGAVLIYGDPGYYVRFGFEPAEKFAIGTPDDFYADALQALELVPGALNGCAGKFFESEGYHIDEAAALEFDKAFLPKARRDDLPSQRRFKELVQMRRPRKG